MNDEYYYIAVDKTDTIWGIGNASEEALVDALDESLGLVEETDFLILPCNKKLYANIKENGYCHGDGPAYWDFNNRTQLAELIVVEKP